MAHEYVFRGEREPYASNPKDQRAREEAKREAEQLASREPAGSKENLSADAELDAKVGEYQVGGLDSYGASSTATAEGGDTGFDRIVGPDEAGLGGGLDQAEEAQLGVTDEELAELARRRREPDK